MLKSISASKNKTGVFPDADCFISFALRSQLDLLKCRERMIMKNSSQRIPLSIPKINLIRVCRMAVTVILLIAACFSAVSPITPVSSESQNREPASSLHETVDVCTSSPTIGADTTWSAGNIYAINACVVVVSSGATLTLEHGVVVQFGGPSTGLIIEGNLSAEGTSSAPVVFTSVNDNSDTGGSDTANPGEWWGIVLREGSTTTMDYAHIRYAGSDTCVGAFADTNYNSCYNRAQLDARKATLSMDHSEIINGETTGLFLHGDGLIPSVQNTLFENNISDDSSNLGAAIEQNTINMQPTFTNLTFSGNTRDRVMIPVDTLNRDVTLGGAPIGFKCGSNVCPITVVSSYTLTIQPGAELDMTNNYLVYFLVQSGGTLSAIASESDPISILAGQFRFEAESNGQFSHCEIDGNNFGTSVHGLIINTEGISINNSIIKNYSGIGVYVWAPASTSVSTNITDTNILDNMEEGIYLSTSTGGLVNFSMDGGTISANGRSGIIGVTSNGGLNVTLKDLLVDANGTNPASYPHEQGVHVDTLNANLMLENLTITNHPGVAIYWKGSSSISAKNIIASNNTAGNELKVPGGAITTGQEWDLGDADIPVHLTDSITVESGGVLSIAPGTSLVFDATKQLYVKSGGALYALGTADEPITFTASPGASAWYGLKNYLGTMILRHCEVSYADKGLTLGATSLEPPTNSIVQNCKIHHNNKGFSVYAPTSFSTSIVYNEIYDNSVLAIENVGFGPDPINAYNNYWGDPSGPYHATLNPDGLGNPVGNNVNFDPFLEAPPEDQTLVGDVWVSTAGPATISPGEVNDYAIQYLNLQAEPIYNAIAVIQLPLAGKYISSTEGGVYWPARHQVFWVLGDITPGSQAMLTARVRFDWGLASSYTDGSYTVLAGSNYQSEAINFDEYLNFDKDEVEDIIIIEASTIPVSPNFSELYNQAIAEGFEPREAYQNYFKSGKITYMLTLRTPDKRTACFISLDENGYATASTTDGSTFISIEDVAGGQSLNLLTLETTLWGSWEDPEALNSIMVECNFARCLRNCSVKRVSIEVMKSAAKRGAEWLLWGPLLGKFAAAGWAIYEVADMTNELYICYQNCSINPLTGCCVANEILWSPSYWMGNTHCNKYICSASSLSFPPTPTQTPCGYGYRCVAGSNSQGGCKPCIEEYKFLLDPMGPVMLEGEICSENSIDGQKTKCSDLTIRVAKDPNAIYGPLGDVLPEQVMDYRVTCENEGEGDAFGVYIVNDLPEQLDEDTLVINDGGIYLPAERQIVWYIGELGPKGDPTSEAEVTYTAQLKPGLTIGSAVVNQATVYFPSVPEETPTNTWTNLVYPLAATPMLELETDYMTPLAITLAGRPAGSLAFNIETLPISGTLDGDLPNLIYTPIENFSGTDIFTFSVSLDGETSQPAQVTINVLANGDLTGPSVLWVNPEDQEMDVEYSESPIHTIPEGDVYAPIIVAKLSEKVQEETITSSSVSVMEIGGAVIPSVATFDPATNLLTIQLLSPLAKMKSYTITLTTEILDLNGNPLNQNFSWQFFTVKGDGIYLPLIIR